MSIGNKEVLAKNLKKYILKSGKDRTTVAEDLGFSYSTLPYSFNTNSGASMLYALGISSASLSSELYHFRYSSESCAENSTANEFADIHSTPANTAVHMQFTARQAQIF